ncbi:MAG: response regulator transcription factor [Gammaproteobacteria bacterium]|nr:response regulator transcription factor [Gammaproteobacteria bacterium]MDH3506579.1 response regulator transcription factor [Gammaproteobacteria bacterium]
MDKDSAVVYVVDDDEAVRDSLELLLESVDLPCQTFASASDFLEKHDPDQHSCLVADIRMPGMSGLDLQEELNDRSSTIPILFITGHGDVPMAVDAMKSGALDFIQKPFRDQELLDRIHQALERDEGRREDNRELSETRNRIGRLTARETEVMHRVVQGQANKVIALDLGVSQRTVEIHRARVMQKMGARSLAELVRMVGKLID